MSPAPRDPSGDRTPYPSHWPLKPIRKTNTPMEEKALWLGGTFYGAGVAANGVQ